jgi:hypothetical protein
LLYLASSAVSPLTTTVMESIVREHAGSEAGGLREVAIGVWLRLRGEQREDAEEPVVDPDGHGQARTKFTIGPWNRIEQLRVACVQRVRRMVDADDLVRARGAREHFEVPVRQLRQQIRLVVRHDARGHLAELAEDLADVQPARKPRIVVRDLELGA